MTTTRTREIDQFLAERLIGEEFEQGEWERLAELRLIPEDVVLRQDGISASIDAVVSIGDEYYDIDDCFCCARCGEYDLNDNACGVDDEDWCGYCRDNHTYYWESDGEYHSDPEPEDDDNEDEDEQFSRDCGIASYHQYSVNPSHPVSLPDDVIGVELETYWDDPGVIAEYLAARDMIPQTGWKAERDGSLDSAHGVEIVSRPIPYADLIANHPENQWQQLFKFAKGKSRAWDMGKGYGLHLSINGAKMSRLHRIKFSRFINGTPELCSKIAGRNQVSLAQYTKTDRFVDQCKYHDKYLACAIRTDDRIEVRIFRASWNWPRFVRNCQFVESVRRYTCDCSLSDVALSEPSYLRWLNGLHVSQFRDLRQWIGERSAVAAAQQDFELCAE